MGHSVCTITSSSVPLPVLYAAVAFTSSTMAVGAGSLFCAFNNSSLYTHVIVVQIM